MTKKETLATNFAVSLEYEGSGAPKVTAKGRESLKKPKPITSLSNKIMTWLNS